MVTRENAEQADNLNKLLDKEGKKLEKVIELKVDELFDRVEGRRVHLPSGRTYHIQKNPPKTEGFDEVTGEPLVHRDDDKKEVLKLRLGVYNKKPHQFKLLCAERSISNSRCHETYR
jgi:adenylate kinase